MTVSTQACIRTACAAACALVLAGCSEVAYKPPRHDRGTQPAARSTDPDKELDTAGQPADLGQAIGARDPLPGQDIGVSDQPRSHEDYIAKCDIYWELYWMKEALDVGKMPAQFPHAMAKIEKENSATIPDEKQDLIADILRNLREGAEADKSEGEIRRAGSLARNVPWGAGRYAVQRAVRVNADLHAMGHAGITAGRTQPIPAEVERIARMVGECEDRYHVAPHDVRTRAFATARAKIPQLGEMLGLGERPAPSRPR